MGKYLTLVKEKKQQLNKLKMEKQIQKFKLDSSYEYSNKLKIDIDDLIRKQHNLNEKINNEIKEIDLEQQRIKIGIKKFTIGIISIISLIFLPISIMCGISICLMVLESLLISSLFIIAFEAVLLKTIIPYIYSKEKTKITNNNKIIINNNKIIEKQQLLDNTISEQHQLISEQKIIEKQYEAKNNDLNNLLIDLKSLLNSLASNNNLENIQEIENNLSKKYQKMI